MKTTDLIEKMKALSTLTEKCKLELHTRGITASQAKRLSQIMTENTRMIESIENQLRKRRIIF